MKIACTSLETPIILKPDRPFVLCIENPREYYRFIKEFVAAFCADASEFTFWEDDRQIAADKAGEILTDLFTFDFADKKIISLLYKRLQRTYSTGSLIFEFEKVKAAAGKFLSELVACENFAVDFEDIQLDALLKACSVKPEKNYSSLLEKIVCYINIVSELKGCFCFVFAGLKSVLTDEELVQLYRDCELNKISLLLLESGKIRPFLEKECAVTITYDLCEIIEKSDWL